MKSKREGETSDDLACSSSRSMRTPASAVGVQRWHAQDRGCRPAADWPGLRATPRPGLFFKNDSCPGVRDGGLAERCRPGPGDAARAGRRGSCRRLKTAPAKIIAQTRCQRVLWAEQLAWDEHDPILPFRRVATVGGRRQEGDELR